jgi:transposase
LRRRRAKKGSNDDWTHPDEPDAHITKMKDGRTHLAHKQEQAVDLETGAVLAVTLAGGTVHDTHTLDATLAAANATLVAVRAADAAAAEVRTYIAEPERGRRCWEGKHVERDAVYRNRRRIRGARGKALLRSRGELLERPFAHALETGGMRRTYLRRHGNILKRLLVHFGGVNLGLLMRTRYGVGTPRSLQGRAAALRAVLHAWARGWDATMTGCAVWPRRWAGSRSVTQSRDARSSETNVVRFPAGIAAFTTGC